MTISRGILYETSSGGVLFETATGGLLYDNSGVYNITKDDYFTRTQPAKSDELKNRVVVKYTAFVEELSDEVYRSEVPISLGVGESVTIEAEYNNLPCVDAVGSIENESGSTFAITVEDYYSWGAIVTVENTGGSAGTCELVIDATPVVIDSESYETSEDTDSIDENKVIEYRFPDNLLIQNSDNAAAIAAALVSSYSTPRNDVSLSWRGDPSLELGDEIETVEYQKNDTLVKGLFYIYKQKLDFDGALSAQLEGRKI